MIKNTFILTLILAFTACERPQPIRTIEIIPAKTNAFTKKTTITFYNNGNDPAYFIHNLERELIKRDFTINSRSSSEKAEITKRLDTQNANIETGKHDPRTTIDGNKKDSGIIERQTVLKMNSEFSGHVTYTYTPNHRIVLLDCTIYHLGTGTIHTIISYRTQNFEIDSNDSKDSPSIVAATIAEELAKTIKN